MARHYDHHSEVPSVIWPWPNFTPAEIACRGDGATMINDVAMSALQALRTSLARPLTINSGYRSPWYNAKVGGAARSQHLTGTAFDIAPKGVTAEELIEAAKAVGFTGIGRIEPSSMSTSGPRGNGRAETMAPLIPIALAIAQAAAPSLVRWIAGDQAGDVAKQVVDTAVAVTGVADGDAALAALKADPETVLRFQQAVLALEGRLYAEDTRRLEAINATMRAEAASADPFVRRMRPTFGYVMAFTWGATMLALSYLIVVDPGAAARRAAVIGATGQELSTGGLME